VGRGAARHRARRRRRPVRRPGKVLAVGVNYQDHAEEAKIAVPKRPIIFAKASSCITGPGMPIHLPRVSSKLDFEGELCVVIGRRMRHVPAADALGYVAGWMIGNDVSVRDWQFHSPTWTMGKSFDTHGPTGPWLVTTDEVTDPAALRLRTWVNGVLKQDGRTSAMIFGVPALLEYLAQAAGVGSTRDPREYLGAGDVVRIEIDGLGALENRVVPEP
jgi:2-keto-4-pentenoate hydratase/2-oxohepta-3-ene-1,7-dioic acid hydratase in catechol pathway